LISQVGFTLIFLEDWLRNKNVEHNLIREQVELSSTFINQETSYLFQFLCFNITFWTQSSSITFTFLSFIIKTSRRSLKDDIIHTLNILRPCYQGGKNTLWTATKKPRSFLYLNKIKIEILYNWMQLKNIQNIWEGLKGMQESRAYLDWRWTWVNTFSNLCELMSKKGVALQTEFGKQWTESGANFLNMH
jgi:hypothetical protein